MRRVDVLDVVKYKKKYLNIIRFFGNDKLQFMRNELLIQLRDEIDFNFAYIINNDSDSDLVQLYDDINKKIEFVTV